MRFLLLSPLVLLALAGCVSVYGEKKPETRTTVVSPPPPPPPTVESVPPSGVVVTRP